MHTQILKQSHRLGFLWNPTQGSWVIALFKNLGLIRGETPTVLDGGKGAPISRQLQGFPNTKVTPHSPVFELVGGWGWGEGDTSKLGDQKHALITQPPPPQLKTFQLGTPPPNSPKYPNIPVSTRGWGGGVPKCVMAPAQVCQAQFPGRLRGLRPSGKGRVKSAFQKAGKKGGGGEREEEKQTRSVCRETQSTVHKGGPRGAKGAAQGTAHPHTCAGVGGGMWTAHSFAGASGGELPTSRLGEERRRLAPRSRSR